MSVLTLNVDEVMRTLSAESSNPFVVHDKEVDIVRFAINSGFADIVLDGQVALRVMYQRPGETEVRAQTLTYYDTDGLHHYYDWKLSQSDLAKDGSLMVALCILDISGGEVSEWHTTPCAVRVLSTIHTDDSDEADETITPTVAQRVAVLETMIQRVASGAPIVVASTSDMTDTAQIYVLSTDGNWYYHNGSAWVAGGEYGAVATDRTLTQSGIPADAKAVGDVRENLIFGKICSITDIGAATWIQGAISNTGSLGDSTTRCRSKSLVGYDSAALIRIEIATGYEVSVIEYRDQKAIVANFVQRLVPFKANKIEFTPITEYMYRLVIRATDGGDISPETIPDDCVHVYVYSVKTLKAEDLDFAVNTLKVLAADGDNELIDWEQGTLSITTGRPNSASNRVRSKLYATYNSLRYLYVYCPSDFKLAVRVYEQSDAATQVQTYNFKTGFYIVEHTEGTMYKFILKKIDETDLTPSDVPSDLAIIPVFNSHWSKKAHGESVASRTTKRSNPTYVSQIVSVAQSYYDHRNDTTSGRRDMAYGSDTAVRQDTYTNQIDCSTFVGLVLRGVLYTDTQYYTKVDTPAASVIANPDFVWSLNPQYYDYYSGDLTTEPDDATRASQLGEWMVDMGWRVPKDTHLLNLEVGDIIFYSRLNAQGTAIAQPDRFMSINHIALVVDKVPTVQGDGYYEGGFKYKHTMMEVTNVTPCVQTQIVETGWDTPSAVNTNNYNTLSLICRPDLGSI